MDSEKTVLLDFWAPWCAPCRMVVPIIEEIAGERPDIKVGKINVDERPELASKFGIMSIPTLVVMKNGKIVQQVSGVRPKNAILETEQSDITVAQAYLQIVLARCIGKLNLVEKSSVGSNDLIYQTVSYLSLIHI